MARPRKDPEIRRAQFLDAAEHLFNERGYEETTVSDIVKQTGVAHGLFYYYFDSKLEVLNAVIDRIMTRMREEARHMLTDEGTDAPSKLLSFLRLYIETRKDNRLMDLIHDESNAPIYLRLRRELWPQRVPIIRSIVEQGVEEGVFDSAHPEETAAGIILMFEMVEMMDRTPESLGIHPERIAPLQDLMERVLGAEKGVLDGFDKLWEGLFEYD